MSGLAARTCKVATNYNLATFIPGASTTANIQQRPPDPRAPAYNKGLSDFDRTHVVSVAPIYDLPKLAGVNPVARAVLGNWTVSGILSLRSGHMYTPVDLGPGCLCGATFGASRATLTGVPV